MPDSVYQRLWGWQHAFDHPLTVWVCVVIAGALFVAGLAIAVCRVLGKLTPEHQRELWLRYRSWLVMVPLVVGPILFGAAPAIVAFMMLSLCCFHEYARITGLFRHKSLSLATYLGIGVLHFAALDHWYGLFTAMMPVCISLLAAVALFDDHPKGYIQRVALAVFGFVLFGVGLSHLSFAANDMHYRPMLLALLLCVCANDVFAYVCGKTFGKRKLCPKTSPNKTIGGAVGAVVCTALLLVLVGRLGLAQSNSNLATWPHLIALGVLISVGGQLGDLMLSAIKRDIGIKDTGSLIPGHGGLLDRCDSLLLVAPGVFHYAMYFHGVALGYGQPQRILTSWMWS